MRKPMDPSKETLGYQIGIGRILSRIQWRHRFAS
jgi:hypothetical protein